MPVITFTETDCKFDPTQQRGKLRCNIPGATVDVTLVLTTDGPVTTVNVQPIGRQKQTIKIPQKEGSL